MDSPEYLAAMRLLTEKDITYALEMAGMRVLTHEEVVEAFKKMAGETWYWHVTPPDTPDRHKDYLPLNLWDQTKDE